MKIGIDATPLAIPFPCGTKHYSQKLIEGLSKIDTKNEYLIFVPKKVEIPKQKNFKLIMFPSFFPILKRQLFLAYMAKKQKLDVFHYLEPYGSYFFRHPAIITTIHDFDLEQTYPFFGKYFLKRLYCEAVRFGVIKNTKVLITDSKSIGRELKNFLTTIKKRAKIYPIPLAHDPAFRPLTKKARGRNYFLSMGDFAPRKNVNGVLKAYSILGKDLQKIFGLKIVASTNESAEQFWKTANSLGIQKFIKIEVNVQRTKLVELYQNAVAFLYPSLYEGFGIPILEAMACGCPVITSNRGCMKELGRDDALLVDPSSPESISMAMRNIVENPSLARMLEKRGLSRAKEFSWEKTERKTLGLYRQIYNENKGL
jgi:glycosyltransferase involved in cell wall biosynthesis